MKPKIFKRVNAVLSQMAAADTLKSTVPVTRGFKAEVKIDRTGSFIELTNVKNQQAMRAYFTNQEMLEIIVDACQQMKLRQEVSHRMNTSL